MTCPYEFVYQLFCSSETSGVVIGVVIVTHGREWKRSSSSSDDSGKSSIIHYHQVNPSIG